MSKTTFIYALCEPGTRTVRYIGKADNPKRRFRGHLNSTIKEKTPLGEWLRTGVRPELVVLREVPYEDWEMAEERYIRLARGCRMNLFNVGDGGEGVTHTPEVRKKMSDSHKGVKLGPMSKARRAAISERVRGPKHGMFGNTHTPEASEAISAGLQGRQRTGSSSFFSGVCWDKNRRKWAARIGCAGQHFALGRFEDEIDAALAYDAAAIKLYGPSAKTNFPVKTPGE